VQHAIEVLQTLGVVQASVPMIGTSGKTFDEIVAAQNLAASGAASLLPPPARTGPTGAGVPVDEFGVPHVAAGGVMPWTGLAHLEKGEVVSRSGGPTVIINGDVVGLSKTELADELGRIFTQARRLQGLSG
jgi:hypothetical protein